LLQYVFGKIYKSVSINIHVKVRADAIRILNCH